METFLLILAGVCAMAFLAIAHLIRKPAIQVRLSIRKSWLEKLLLKPRIRRFIDYKLGPKVFSAIELEDGTKVVFLEGDIEDFSVDVEQAVYDGGRIKELEGELEKELIAVPVLEPPRIVELAFGREYAVRRDERGQVVAKVPWLDMPAFRDSHVTNRQVLEAYVEDLLRKERVLFVMPRIPRGMLERLERAEMTYLDAVHVLHQALRERERALVYTTRELNARILTPVMSLCLYHARTALEQIAIMDDLETLLAELMEVLPTKVKEPLVRRGFIRRVEDMLKEAARVREELRRVFRSYAGFLSPKDVEELAREVGVRVPAGEEKKE